MQKKRKSGKASTKEKTWKPVIDLKVGHNRVVNDFTADEVTSIWHATGLKLPMPRGLFKGLNKARARYTVALHMQRKPTARQLALRAKRIANLSAHLRDTLLIGGKLSSGLGAGGLWAVAAREGNPSPVDAVKQACDCVEALERWATALEKEQTAKSKTDLENKKKKVAEWQLQYEGWKIKHEEWKKKPQKSLDPEDAEPIAPTKPTGNANKALNAFISELGIIFFRNTRRLPRKSRVFPYTEQNRPAGPFFRFVRQTLQIMGSELSDEAVVHLIRRHGQMRI